MHVDDDIHAKQGHAELNSELSDQGGHGLGAGRRQARHLLVQLRGQEEKGHYEVGFQPSQVPNGRGSTCKSSRLCETIYKPYFCRYISLY